MMQNVHEVEDLRVRRTRKLLQEAFIELTVEKGFAAITVRDITERAMVNRSTFYRHFLDKYDLMEQYTNEVTAGVWEAELAAEKTRQGEEDIPAGLLSLLRHVQAFADFYRVMLGQRGDPVFTERIRLNAASRFRALLSNVKTDPNGPPDEMRISYVSCAGIGAIMWWLENDQPCNIEQLARWIGQLSKAAVGLPLPGKSTHN
ncbi:MAG: TetR/AcrR family transcriptional regulator [Anaerolineae bacterium]|nr:TetR/AcrR family transcriptional regulator [Anaerolineae bacterium]